jgi:hypothetical protein
MLTVISGILGLVFGLALAPRWVLAAARFCSAPDRFADFNQRFDFDAFCDHRDRGHGSCPAGRGNDACGVFTI